MRAIALVPLLALGGCILEARAPLRPMPPTGYSEAPAAAPAPAGNISRDQAIEIAFRVAGERGLQVDQVQHVSLDQAGRWHVDVRGRGDRARILIDARDGRLLRGRFKAHGGGRDHEREDEDWDD